MQRKSTVYVVDDEPQVLEAISHLIKPFGMEVKKFSRADDFLSSFQYEGPACLVLDVRMPGMSGMELLSRLSQMNCKIPVIFITGHADVQMAVDAVKSGAVNFLEKPFLPQELFDEIQKALRADIEAWQRRADEYNIEKKLALLKAGEREVLDLIREGKTNEEIAKDLNLSVRGVEARRAKAMKTLRVDSKTELLQMLRLSPVRNSTRSPS
jgi:two-component system, LuxR family, response regulator FixJ